MNLLIIFFIGLIVLIIILTLNLRENLGYDITEFKKS